MGLIKLIATFLLFYLVFRFFTMYLFPSLARWYIYRAKKKYYGQNPHLRNEKQKASPRSKVRITEDPSRASGVSDGNIGDYVDFEEIKDDDK